MKVPDKIYMPNELLSEEWQRHIESQDTEYIRSLYQEMSRGRMYADFERQAYEDTCNLFRQA